MRRCVADSGYFLPWRPGFGAAGIAAEFAMADDANRSMAAPKLCRIDLCRRLASGVDHGGPPGPGAAAIPHAISSSTIRMLRCGKQGIEAVVVWSNRFRRTHCRKSPCARGTLDLYRRGNSVARRRNELAFPSSPIAQRRMWPKIKLCTIVL